MGVNENSGKSVSSSITVRRADQSSRVVALASGDAGSTGQPRDGDDGLPGTAWRPRRRRLRSDNGLIKVHAAGPRGRALGTQQPRVWPPPGGPGEAEAGGNRARPPFMI